MSNIFDKLGFKKISKGLYYTILSIQVTKKFRIGIEKFRFLSFSKKISLCNAKKFRFLAICANFTQIFSLKCDKIGTKVTKMLLKQAKISYFCHHFEQKLYKMYNLCV